MPIMTIAPAIWKISRMYLYGNTRIPFTIVGSSAGNNLPGSLSKKSSMLMCLFEVNPLRECTVFTFLVSRAVGFEITWTIEPFT